MPLYICHCVLGENKRTRKVNISHYIRSSRQIVENTRCIATLEIPTEQFYAPACQNTFKQLHAFTINSTNSNNKSKRPHLSVDASLLSSLYLFF